MKPRTLLVGWGYPPEIDGGLDIHVKHLFEELIEKGLDVKLVLPKSRAPDKERIIGVETGEGDMIERSRKMSQEVAKLSKDFDIVHTHDWFGAESGYKSRKYGNVLWVSTLHSLASDRTREPDERLTKFEELCVKKSDLLISVSNSLANSIEELYREKPEIIYNGFSEPQSSGIDVKMRHGIEGKMIFYVGRHTEQKGLEHLLYGFKKVLEVRKDVKLVIGGKGHMTTSLKEFSSILGIDDNVVFTGFIPGQELGDYYTAADAFISPSINEPFGLTITEALNMGTPVVATQNGVEELSGSMMISIKPESDSIKEGILKALDTDISAPESYRNWTDMAEETLELYRNLYDRTSNS